jgi:hypothetical protein
MVEAQRMAPAPTVEHHEAFAPSGWLAGVCAFAVYLVASTITYAGSTIAHLSTEYIPRQDASDSEFFRWALTWAPWAVTHGRDPLFTDVLYAPHGASLVWTTAVPGPALAMWPVTTAFGPLVSYNVLSLLAPTLAGWGAYLLCRRVSHRFWPSLLGGAVFGFSAYMTIQLNHPNLALTFPIPLAVYLTVRRVEGSLGRIAYIALLSLTLLALWSISIEVFATTTMFAGIAYLIALAVAWTDRRPLIAALPWIAIAYAIVIALVLFPYLLPALREAPTSVSIDPEKKYVDLMRFILPRDRQLVGEGWLMARTAGAVDPDSSGVGFIGIGLVAMIAGYAITERRRRETWGILAFLLIAATLALGPRLYILDRRTIPLPSALLLKLPLIENALPGRFMIFVTLTLAVIAALWLSRARGRSGWIRYAIVVVGLLLVIPNVQSPQWRVPDVTPAFFQNGAWRNAIGPGETVAVMAEKKAQDMAWQAETNMAFRLPDGYLGAIPEVDNSEFARGLYPPRKPHADVLRGWIAAHGVTAIIVMDSVRPWFEPLLGQLGYVPVQEGNGVSVWRTG